jgi:hypothetical protein
MNTGPARVALLTLTLAIAAAGCGTARAPSATPPKAPAGPAASSAPAGQGSRGQFGWAAWRVTGQGLSLSSDGGRHFAPVPLPASAAPADVVAVAHRAGGATWLGVAGPGRSVTVYTRDPATGRWSAGTKLTPAWPHSLGAAASLPPSRVAITPGKAHQVLVTIQLVLSHSVAITRNFVSNDGGARYVQRVLPATSDLNAPWWSAVLSGEHGVAVLGDRMDQVVHTADGGSTWSASALSGIGGDYVAGPAIFAGSTVYLPVTEAGASGRGAFVLLRSTDGGATFTAGGDQTVRFGGPFDPAPAPLSAAAGAWWLVPPTGGTVYRSLDGGRSWSKAPAPLPPGVISIGAGGARNATVTIQQNRCAHGKSGCTSKQFLETTSDAGASWTRL